MKAIILNLKKSETLKKVRLFFKRIMNKLSLKEYIYSVMIQNNEECLYVTTSEVQEIVQDEINSMNILGESEVEDVVENMDIKYIFDIPSDYEIDDKIADAIVEVNHAPITNIEMDNLKKDVIEKVVEKMEAKKSPTIREIEQSQKNMKHAFNMMLKMATKKDVVLTSDNNKLVYDLLDNYLNGGNKNMK